MIWVLPRDRRCTSLPNDLVLHLARDLVVKNTKEAKWMHFKGAKVGDKN